MPHVYSQPSTLLTTTSETRVTYLVRNPRCAALRGVALAIRLHNAMFNCVSCPTRLQEGYIKLVCLDSS